MSVEGDGHPHRCRRGHRWHHAGPTAVTCEIPSYDAASGDLPYIPPEDCPLCMGREDVLVRDSHRHHCTICDGDWAHEGRCIEGPFAPCPWCFAPRGAVPAPGERKGRHFHLCPECGHSYEHLTPCAAPLRASLVDDPDGHRHAHSASHPGGAMRRRTRPRGRARARARRRRWVTALGAVVLGFAATVVGIRLIDFGTARPQRGVPVEARGQADDATPLGSPLQGERAERRHMGPTDVDGGGTAPDSESGLRALRSPEGRRRPESVGERTATQAPAPPREAGPPAIPIPSEPDRVAAPPAPLTIPVPPAMPVPPTIPLPPTAPSISPASPPTVVAEPPRPVPTLPSVVTRPELAADISEAVPAGAPQGAPSPSPGTMPKRGAPADPRFALPRQEGQDVLARRPSPETRAVVTEPSSGTPSRPLERWRIDAAQAAVVSVLPALDKAGARRSLPPRGLGVVVDRSGYIVTTDTIARGIGALDVELADGRQLPVALIARDPLNDIAVLKVDATGLPALVVGDSSAVKTGDVVAAVGPHEDPGGAVTRIMATGEATGGNLVTDARVAASPGGALINVRGEVVGILAASGPNGATTGAVPIDRAKAILRDLKARRPAAGVERPGVSPSER
jgi:S1-C subfamily serine protease